MSDRAEPSGSMVRIWDPLVRLFHWITVMAFAGAFIIGRPRDLHEALGLTVAAALTIRVIWGFVGSRHARFTDFVPGPRRLAGYLGDLVRGREQRFLGHNPAGGAMVLALMSMLALTAATGWMSTLDAFWGNDALEALHEGAANLTLALVGLHVAGVVWESLKHGENLVKAMVTGLKRS